MTREEKISALIEDLGYENSDHIEDIKEIILAGIALRDAELLAMEFDEGEATKELNRLGMLAFNGPSFDDLISMARWQFEQFMKAIKGE